MDRPVPLVGKESLADADTYGMSKAPGLPEDDARHFSCALTAVAIARLKSECGEDSVRRLLEQASSKRPCAYLTDIGNWISYDEMIAIWRAAAEITGDSEFARHAGEDAVRRLGSSSTSIVLRGLGSPEELLRQIRVASGRFSSVAEVRANEVRPGFADIQAVAAPGFPRHRLHCEWTRGMLCQATVLFGFPPATVEHPSCQADGATECRYLLSWDPEATLAEDPPDRTLSLERQLQAMSETLDSVFATAADLIASGDLDDTLANITERAAQQVRAPGYLLAVRPSPGSRVHRHHKGLSEERSQEVAERVLAPESDPLPESWLTAPVRSQRNHYGWLVAIYEPGATFFPQERQLLEVYARYAATVLDSSSALTEARQRQQEAQRRYEESHALLDLARRLATAESSEAVARRLAEAVPSMIDCDRVTVFIWDEAEREFVRRAVGGDNPGAYELAPRKLRPEQVPRLAALLEQPNPEPLFASLDSSGPDQRDLLRRSGAEAVVTVPIATEERLLGCLVVSVEARPERLRSSPELRDRLSGVAAHAVTALENGRLVDRITHQARHDHLTNLLNRMGFKEALAAASRRALDDDDHLGLFFLDLDSFKAVNDEFGHEVGDELLGAIADRLTNRLRSSDQAARLGGDEFAVLVERIGDDEPLEAIEERLRATFWEPFRIGDSTIRIEASIGCAVWPLDVKEPEELLRRADAAMYEMKRRRPNLPSAR
jgi:diguanylate cyclase (GGDEF)-like protein